VLEGFKGRFYQLIMALGDFVLVFVSFMAANYLYGLLGNDVSFPDYHVSLSISCISITLFFFFDCYSFVKRKNIKSILVNSVLALIITNIPLFFINHTSVMLFFFMAAVLLISLFRYGWWYVSQVQFGQKRVWVISNDPNEKNRLFNKILNHSPGWFVLAGFILSKDYKKLIHQESKVDAILLCPSIKGDHKNKIIQYFSRAEKEILLMPDFTDLLIATSDAQQLDDMMVYSIQPAHVSKGNHMLKRLFDIVISTLLLLLSSPVMLLLYVLIPLTSRGPALFLQERIGLNGKPYFVYKFRSMENNAEKDTGPTLAVDNDPRVTKIGKWIRDMRIDELPQLFNVLQGDMSMVGPRPERDYFIEQFKNKIPQYGQRLTVKPGITGLAQVLANYSTSVEDKVHYDLVYIRQYSFDLDVKILLQTIRVILQRDQAQGVQIHSIMSPKDFPNTSFKDKRTVQS
jgi:exopolysaccharide biosynthesis polyprenyl glycosylphosphotransferase